MKSPDGRSLKINKQTNLTFGLGFLVVWIFFNNKVENTQNPQIPPSKPNLTTIINAINLTTKLLARHGSAEFGCLGSVGFSEAVQGSCCSHCANFFVAGYLNIVTKVVLFGFFFFKKGCNGFGQLVKQPVSQKY